jgi:hypothetical protein
MRCMPRNHPGLTLFMTPPSTSKDGGLVQEQIFNDCEGRAVLKISLLADMLKGSSDPDKVRKEVRGAVDQMIDSIMEGSAV